MALGCSQEVDTRTQLCGTRDVWPELINAMQALRLHGKD